jgi:protein-tyrosine kinase
VSKNFELMQEAGQDQELFRKNGNGSTPARNGRRHNLLIEGMMKEETAKLVQRLFLLPGSQAPHAVVFSAVESGGGCTSVCARTAEMIMAMGKGTVCVVDANLRGPALHDYFGLENRKGFSDSLVEAGRIRSFAQQVYGGKLWVLTAGTPNTDPAPVLNSSALAARIAELRSEFDYVLIDSPPVNQYGDAVTLAKQSDGALLILQSSSTRREAARKSKELFEAGGTRLLGAVLNKRTYSIPQRLYEKL